MRIRKTGRKIQKVFLTAVFLILLAGCLYLADRLVERKDSREKNGDYFAAAPKADVLLLGSSHMINGINPAVLYENFGIASYNLGGHGNVLPVTYWEFVNALDYGTPKYVVIDTYLLEKDYQYLDVMTDAESDADRSAAIDQLHEVMDAFPYGKNKRAALSDLISDPSLRREFAFDFIRYHSRWSSLEREDYEGVFGEPCGESILGAQLRYEVDPGVFLYPRVDPSEKFEDATVGKTYLRRILDLCREKDIFPILVQVPFAENEDLQRIANSAQDIADEYGVPFLNMNYVENIINPETDQQSQTHLNALGAAKTSAWLGAVLSSEVGVPDRRGEAGYELWEAAVRKYHQQIVTNILNPEDLYAELMALNFNDVSTIIFINNDSVAFYDDSLRKLIKNLSGTDGIDVMAGTKLGYCLIHDPVTDTNEETKGTVPLENIQTSFGTVNFTTLENYDLLSVGENTDENQLDYVNNGNIDVQILIYDPASGEKIGHLYFRDGGLVRG